MNTVKKILFGLLWSFLFLLLRNLSFQFDDIIVVVDSLVLGVLVHKLRFPLWRLMVLITVSLPLTDLVTIYVNSVIPFLIGYYTVSKKRKWTFYFWYLIIPISLVLGWLYRSESHSMRFDKDKPSELALYPLLNPEGAKYLLSPDTTYVLSYWHLGCRSCLTQDKALRVLEYRNRENPVKVLSVFLGDSADSRFKPTVDLFHRHYPNYVDRNELLQQKLDQDYGPALMLYKDGRPQKVWHAFTSDNWKRKLMPYYWQWYLNH